MNAYNIFRWYRAGWGRYSQTDPIGLIAGVNLYAYARNTPTTTTDPHGLNPANPVDAAKCCYYLVKCASEGTECSNKWKSELKGLKVEDKLKLFESAKVVTESDFLKKKCFDSNPNCTKMVVVCGSWALKPSFGKDSADPSPLPLQPKKWWEFWKP